MEKKPSLEKLVIMGKRNSLYVVFDSETGILSLRGHSIPDNALKFFEPIMTWTKEYLQLSPEKISLNVSFEYLHTGASKQIFILLQLLNEWRMKGNIVNVNWYYEEDDEDMKNLGLDFSSVLNFPFRYEMFE